MDDVNLEGSLIVKGWRVDGRLHTIYYQTFKNEQYETLGQGSYQKEKGGGGGEH